MSKKSSFLYELIINTDRYEKRFLHAYLSKYNTLKKSNSLYLFQLIDKHQTDDEKLLKEKLSGSPILKNYAFEKNHLYNQLLKGLSIYYDKLDMRTQINDWLKQVAILIHKNLFSQASEILLKAKKQAEIHHLSDLLYSIIEYEIKIMVYLDKSGLDKTEEQIIELKDTIKKLDNLADFYDLRGKIYYHYIFRNENSILQIKKLLKHPLFNNYENALTFRAKMYFDWSHTMAFHNTEESLFYHQRIINLFYQHPEIMVDRLSVFCRLVSNYFRTLMMLKSFEEAKKVLSEFEKLPVTYKKYLTKWQKDLIKAKSLIDHLDFNFRRHQFEKVIELESAVNKLIYKKENNFNQIDCVVTYMLLGVSYFELSQFDKAMSWFEYIENKFKGPQFLAFQRVASFIIILCQLNLENFTLIPYITKSYRRKYLKRKDMNGVEKKIIRFLEYELTKSQEKNDVEQNMLKLYNEIEPYFDSSAKLNKMNWSANMYIWLKKKQLLN